MNPEKREYRKLDYSKITFTEEIKTIEECLCGIDPVLWKEDDLGGDLKVASP